VEPSVRLEASSESCLAAVASAASTGEALHPEVHPEVCLALRATDLSFHLAVAASAADVDPSFHPVRRDHP